MKSKPNPRDGEPPRKKTPTIRVELTWASVVRVLGSLCMVWLLVRVWPALILILLAAMVSASLYSPVRVIKRWAPGWVAVALVTVAVLSCATVLVLFLAPPLAAQAKSFASHLPENLAAGDRILASARVPFRLSAWSHEWSAKLTEFGPALLGVLGALVSGVTALVTVMVLSLYFLADEGRLVKSLVDLLPKADREAAHRVLHELAQQVGGYVRGQVITSAMSGTVAGVVLFSLGVPDPLPVAAIVALSDVIPIVGVLIGAFAGAVVAASTKGVTAAIVVASVLVVYHLFEAHVVTPRVYGKTMKLSSAVVIVSLLIGAELMGIMGALLALPVAAALPVVVRFLVSVSEHQSDPPPA